MSNFAKTNCQKYQDPDVQRQKKDLSLKTCSCTRSQCWCYQVLTQPKENKFFNQPLEDKCSSNVLDCENQTDKIQINPIPILNCNKTQKVQGGDYIYKMLHVTAETGMH